MGAGDGLVVGHAVQHDRYVTPSARGQQEVPLAKPSDMQDPWRPHALWVVGANVGLLDGTIVGDTEGDFVGAIVF